MMTVDVLGKYGYEQAIRRISRVQAKSYSAAMAVVFANKLIYPRYWNRDSLQQQWTVQVASGSPGYIRTLQVRCVRVKRAAGD